MPDATVITSYPHDRLSRLAAAMTDALDKVPGTGDVRAVVLLDDGEGGCEHAHNYPKPVDRPNGPLFVDTAAHLFEMGKALGVKVEVLINGKKVPGPKGGAR
jgi:hypothetical protein